MIRDITYTNHSPKNKTAAALGVFDGVHRGHAKVLSCAAEYKSAGFDFAVFTFDTNTVTTKKDVRGGRLLTEAAKHERLESFGADYIFSPDFSDIKDMGAEEFVDEILIKRLNAGAVVCGYDFRFGKGASGDAKTLLRLCKERQIKADVVPAQEFNGQKISSTRIRGCLRSGDIRSANAMLGYNYYYRLVVAEGNKIGRTLDFPTVNQELPKELVLPKFGVYCSVVTVGAKRYMGVTNIGIKPTVHVMTTPLAETYIIGYEGELYGETVKVELCEFVREERSFDSLEALKAEISANTAFTLEYFKKNKSKLFD